MTLCNFPTHPPPFHISSPDIYNRNYLAMAHIIPEHFSHFQTPIRNNFTLSSDQLPSTQTQRNQKRSHPPQTNHLRERHGPTAKPTTMHPASARSPHRPQILKTTNEYRHR